jgi:hypothetical protein
MFSLLLLVLGQTIKALNTQTSLEALKVHLSFKESYKIWFLSQTSKYIPGGIWPHLSRVFFYSQHGISTKAAGAIVGIETLSMAIGGLLVSMPIVFSITSEPPQAVLLLVILFLSTYFLYRSVAMRSQLISNKISQIPILGNSIRKALSLARNLSYRLILINVISNILITVAFYLLTIATNTPVPILPGLFIFPLAWGVGFVVFIAPMGVGPRELILALFLKTYFQEETELVLMLLLARLWWSMGDVINISGALALGLTKFSKRR